MPHGIRRIGRPISRVQRGLLKKPIRKANEGPLAWYKRLKRWMDTTERHEKWKERQRSKPKPSSKKVKKTKPKTVRERIIEERKKTEREFGIDRGIKKKPKPKPKKPKTKKSPKKKGR